MDSDKLISTAIVIMLVQVLMITYVLVRPERIPLQAVSNTTGLTSITEGCNGTSIFRDARCMNRNVKSIFKYREHPNSETLTFKELKEEGGSCNDWSMLYYNSAESLGYHSQYVELPINSSISHVFTVISDDEGYCLLDQKRFYCVGYGK